MKTTTFLAVASILGCSLSQLHAEAGAANLPDDATDNMEARPPLWVRGSVRAGPFLASAPGAYNPTQVRHAYGLDQVLASGNTGVGQTIAIVDAYGSPSLANDLSVFCTTFGLPQAALTVYYPQGVPRKANSGWALETSLDAEWAHVVAPGAKIAVVVAKSASFTDLLNAVDYAVNTVGAKQVTMSWGGSEFSSETSSDSHFNKAGVSFFASSGDSGSGVMWPAASPYVTGVGGTTLKLDSAGNVLSETSWSGSGGGISAYESQPVYQSGWIISSKRGVPDISYNADPNTGYPVYISNYNRSTGWITVGGTSAGAPQWGGISALVNSLRSTPLNGAESALYSLTITNYASDIRDVTAGSNGGFNAGSSYDYVTGLGSPLSATLVPYLSNK